MTALLIKVQESAWPCPLGVTCMWEATLCSLSLPPFPLPPPFVCVEGKRGREKEKERGVCEYIHSVCVSV